MNTNFILIVLGSLTLAACSSQRRSATQSIPAPPPVPDTLTLDTAVAATPDSLYSDSTEVVELKKPVPPYEKVAIDSASADSQLISTIELSEGMEYQSLQYKAKCKYEKLGKTLPFTAFIRIQKGKKIWISVMGGGIMEVGRALITPDSVKVLDKLNQVAYIKDVTYLKSLIDVDIDFAMLESILAGKLPDILRGDLESQGQIVKVTDSFDEHFDAVYTIDSSKRVWNELFIDFDTTEVRSAGITFEDYQPVGNSMLISMLRNVMIEETNGNQIKLKMELSKVEANQDPAMPFSVPEGYSYK